MKMKMAWKRLEKDSNLRSVSFHYFFTIKQLH